MARRKPPTPEWATGLNRQPERVRAIIRALRAAYPDARLILQFANPFQLLVATILAAQTTDERVNQVTPGLFARYPDAHALAAADPEELMEQIKPTGYYRQKARFLLECARALVERFQGNVPDRLEDLVTLPGVGKKTAILVLNHAFGRPSGIVVDTHMHRVAQRLDWSHQRDRDRMEEELRALIPPSDWIDIHPLIAFHGRRHCKAPRPACAGCPIDAFCYFPEKRY